ncbi:MULTISPECIES: hypothetical protein [Sorangium]|uniref:Uncharacterized protein n=1 Tax=Sorangium cellulosum TaxID=56 RepID=A0A4P2QFV5_SORCE|nr:MULTISPECIES: hypothetical protein [Sorangium]AUX28764.1 hypothetical protein SOCE836_008450 [Sorangium cellulosum]WCQ88161.1 hypothetical protein NQZ70_00833 [Sorangium sp. Soce836]
MQNCATRSDRLLELILFSLRDRGALCALVLAAYRAELTSLLDRVSAGSIGDDEERDVASSFVQKGRGAGARGRAGARRADPRISEEDAFLVYDLAGCIAEAAAAARLPVVRRDALALREKAAEVHAGGERAEREMFAAGLRVIERILDAARAQPAPRNEPASKDLN